MKPFSNFASTKIIGDNNKLLNKNQFLLEFITNSKKNDFNNGKILSKKDSIISYIKNKQYIISIPLITGIGIILTILVGGKINEKMKKVEKLGLSVPSNPNYRKSPPKITNPVHNDPEYIELLHVLSSERKFIASYKSNTPDYIKIFSEKNTNLPIDDSSIHNLWDSLESASIYSNNSYSVNSSEHFPYFTTTDSHSFSTTHHNKYDVQDTPTGENYGTDLVFNNTTYVFNENGGSVPLYEHQASSTYLPSQRLIEPDKNDTLINGNYKADSVFNCFIHLKPVSNSKLTHTAGLVQKHH